MNFISTQFGRFLRLMRRPALWLSLLMALLIFYLAQPSMFYYVGIVVLIVEPLWDIIIAPFNQWMTGIPAAIIYSLITIFIFYHRKDVKHAASTLKKLALGDGWSAWAMAWLWLIAILISTQPIIATLTYSVTSVMDMINPTFERIVARSFLSPFPLLPVTLGLAIFYHYARKSEQFPKRGAMIAIAAGLPTHFILTPIFYTLGIELAQWTQFFGIESPMVVNIVNPTIWMFVIPSLVSLLIISLRSGFTTSMRLLLFTLIGGTILTSLLSYPAYTFVLDQFVPLQDYSGAAHETVVMAGLIGAGIVTLILGAVSAWVFPSTTVWQRSRNGLVLGGLIGMMVFATIGAWFAGITAHAPLYEFAIDRSDYGEAEWLLSLAIAVSDTFPLTLAAFWSLIGIGAVLSAIGATIIPFSKSQQTDRDIPTWILFATFFVPLVQSLITLSVVILDVLGPVIRNVFVTYGYQPSFQPEWIAPGVAISQFVFLASCQLALIVWLNRRNHNDEAHNPIILNAIFVSGLIAAGNAILQIVGVYAWWSLLIGLLSLAMSIEWMRLSLTAKRKSSGLSQPGRWVNTSILATLAGLFCSYILVGASLSLVLLSVNFIPDLVNVSDPAPGIDYLLNSLNALPLISAGSSIVTFLMVSTTVPIIIALIAVLNLPARAFNSVRKTVVKWLQHWNKRLPQQVLKFTANKNRATILTLILCIVIDLLWTAPAFTLIWGIFALQPTRLRRLPSVISLLALMTLLIFTISSIRTNIEQNRNIWMLVVLAAIVVYHTIGLYIPRENKGYRHLGHGVLIALVTGMLAFLQNPVDSHAGAVSRLDGNNRWTVYDGEHNSPGTNIRNTLMLDNDGTIWVTNGGGIVSLYDGQEWERMQLTSFSTSPIERRASSRVANRSIILNQNSNSEIWAVGDLTISPVRDVTGSYATQMLCYHNQFQRIENPRAAQSCSLGYADNFNESISIASSGDSIWVGTENAIYHIFAGEWQLQSLPSANHIIAHDDRIWIASSYGLYLASGEVNKYIPEEGVFTGIGENIELVLDTSVQQLHIDADGNLLYATPQMLWRLNDDMSSEPMLDFIRSELDLPLVVNVTAMADDGNGVYWIGTNYGLIRYDSTSDFAEIFNSNNSGLVVDTIQDVIVGNQGDVWVSTYESKEGNVPTATIVALVLGTFVIIGFFIGRDYLGSDKNWAKRKARDIAKTPKSVISEIISFLAGAPSTERITAVSEEINKVGLPQGGATLSAFNAIINHDEIDKGLSDLLLALEQKNSADWISTLLAQYQIMQQALAIKHISGISRLELMVNPGQTGTSIGISTADIQLTNLAPFTSQSETQVWQALSATGINLRKYAEVSDTGDRLSYLAAALSSAELANNHSQHVPLPNQSVFQEITIRWRDHISTAINLISGSAQIRLELRTRQIQRDDFVTIVLKIDNVGRAAAENIRIQILDDEVATEIQALNRLSPNRSESLELTIQPDDENDLRVYFRALWDDRLDTDKSLDYADALHLYTTEEDFHTIPNPYIVGHPVKSEQMFFGREDVFNFIESNLSGSVQDRTIVLYGQRRTGKTSLLYQLVGGRLDERFIPVLIDMQSLVMLVESTGDFFGEILYQIEQTLESSDIELEVPVMDADTKSPNRVFSRFIDKLCNTLAKRRILFIFDEFELIESKIAEGKLDPNLLNYFRSLIQHRDNLVFIFAGTHRLDEMSHDYWSILFNIALSRKITFLSDAEARDLIRKPVAEYLTIDDLAVEKMLRLTHGHPLFTQLLCWALINHCNQEKRNYANINDVNDALDTMLKTGEAHFVYLWQELQTQERLLVSALAQSENNGLQPEAILATLERHGAKTDDYHTTIEILDALVRREILQSTTQGALRYSFTLEVFQEWIKHNHTITGLVERDANQ